MLTKSIFHVLAQQSWDKRFALFPTCLQPRSDKGFFLVTHKSKEVLAVQAVLGHDIAGKLKGTTVYPHN